MDENIKKNLEEEQEINETATEEQELDKTVKVCPSVFDKPDADRFRGKEKQPRKRNRKVRDIIIASVLCVVLVATTTGISYLWFGKDPITLVKEIVDPPEDTTENITSDTVSYVHNYSSYAQTDSDTATAKLGGVEKIIVKQPNFTYEITGKLEETVNIDPQTYEEYTSMILNWRVSHVEGMDITGVHFDTTTSGFVVSDLLQIPYNSIYAEDGNATIPQGGMTYYEECGITTSQNRLTVLFKNGASITVIVGNQTPTDNMVFLAFENDDAGQSNVVGAPKKDPRIYKVTQDVVAYYAKDPVYFIETDVVSPVEQDDDIFDEETGDVTEDPYFLSGELSKFDALSITGANYQKPFTFEMVDQDQPGYDSIYLMTSPFTQNVDLDAISTLLSPVANGLSVKECLIIQPTQEEIASYGLDNPACVVNYKVKGQKTVLKIGDKIKGTDTYAFMVEGNNSIFSILESSIPFVTYTTADFASSTLYSCDITLIKTFRVQSDGKDELYRLEHGTDATGNATLTVLNRNNAVVDTEKFRDMYVKLLSLTSFEEVTDGKDADPPHTTITITYYDYPQEHVLRFSPYTDRRYYMSLNGVGSTVIRSTAMNDFVEAFNAMF